MALTYDIRLDAGADYAQNVEWRVSTTVLAAAYTAGDSTVTVVSTDGADSSGYIEIFPQATNSAHKNPPSFFLSYSGKTPTTFTGCSATGQSSTTAINCALYAPVEAVVPLTSFTARLSIRRSIEDAAAVLALTSSSGLTITAALGRVAIAITAAQTAALSGSYVYDLEVESSGGTITRLLQGRVHVSPQVTY